MTRKCFCNIYSFVAEIDSQYKSLFKIYKDDEYVNLSVIGKGYNIRDIVEELVYFGYGIDYIESYLDSENDNIEYVLTISEVLNDRINCEPIFNSETGNYKNIESNIIYIIDDCSSRIIKHCDADRIYDVSFDIFGTDEALYNDNDNDDSNNECSNNKCGSCKNCNSKNDIVNSDDVDDDDNLETQNYNSTNINISKNSDGVPIGFSMNTYSEKDGVTMYTSYTYSSNDIDSLTSIAKGLGINLFV